jgi:hypothetical protein
MKPPANCVQPLGVFAREHGLNVSTCGASAILKKAIPCHVKGGANLP